MIIRFLCNTDAEGSIYLSWIYELNLWAIVLSILIIPRIQRWGAKHAVLLLMKLSALRPYHTMTAGRGGAETTRHEIRGGKNWLAIFICAKLNKRRLLPSSSYYHRVEEEGRAVYNDVGVEWKSVFFFRAKILYCRVREHEGERDQRGFQEWKIRGL